MLESAEHPFAGRFPTTLFVPEQPDLTFDGFHPEAFEILDRLKVNPHVEQYRHEKEDIRQYLTDPFKRYRDDLVVNLVLPNALPLETEKNVFSRLLKNDFGAGGSHHHLWMSFYRLGSTRLKDIQLPHSIDPEGFSVGLYLGSHAPALLKEARQRIRTGASEFSALVTDLLAAPRWRFNYYLGTGASEQSRRVDGPLFDVPADLSRASGLWFRAHFEREEVVSWRGALVPHALRAMQDIWPLYLFFARSPEFDT